VIVCLLPKIRERLLTVQLADASCACKKILQAAEARNQKKQKIIKAKAHIVFWGLIFYGSI